MQEETITRIITIVVGIVGTLGMAVLTLILNAFRKSVEGFVREVHNNTEQLDHLDECFDDLKKVVGDQLKPAIDNIQVEQTIRMVEYWKLREEFAHFKGSVGAALHEPTHTPDVAREIV